MAIHAIVVSNVQDEYKALTEDMIKNNHGTRTWKQTDNLLQVPCG